MKSVSREQVITNIARIICDNDIKRSQLEKVSDISIHLTSDDHVNIRCELYQNNIARYLIIGTRANAVVTANTLTNEIVRKPRGEEPWYVADTDCNVSEIINKANEIKEWHDKAAEMTTEEYQEKRQFLCTDIAWDTDGEKIEGLPKRVLVEETELVNKGYVIENSDVEEIKDRIADYLSDNYGWCISGLSIIELNKAIDQMSDNAVINEDPIPDSEQPAYSNNKSINKEHITDKKETVPKI